MTSTAKRSRKDINVTTDESNLVWTHEQTLQFIELYKKHPHLWDRSHPEYRRSSPRQASLNEISAELNVSIKRLTHKIHRMQTAFNGIWKKMKMAPDRVTAVAAAQKSWPYFDQMQFMEKSYRMLDETRAKKKRPAKRSGRSKKSKTTNANRSDGEFNGFDTKIEQEVECIDSEEEENEWSDDCYIACSSKTTDTFDSSNHISVKYESEQMIPTSTTVTGASTSTISVATAQSSNDRIDVFFRAMADTVKSFPNKNIAEAKLRISQIVGEMELSLASGDEVLVTSFG